GSRSARWARPARSPTARRSSTAPAPDSSRRPGSSGGPQVRAGPGSGTVLVVRAPGRVNLIGDHTDYQDGLCLPMAIDREVVVRARGRTDRFVVARSDAIDGIVELPADARAAPASAEPRWGRSIAAVLQGLAAGPRAPAGH